MRRRRRIAAYGLCRDGEGRTLMVRASQLAARPGDWWLPGGGIDHGEHPADAVVREVAEETGFKVVVTSLHSVLSDVFARPDRGTEVHSDRLVYNLTLIGG